MPRQRGNGSCNVTRVNGKKKNAYRVRVTVGYEYDEQKGKQVQRVKTLGYFQTRQEAEKAPVSMQTLVYGKRKKQHGKRRYGKNI